MNDNSYRAHFLNQYTKIPKEIAGKFDKLYPTIYESVRHCLGLIIINLLDYGRIAYSLTKNFYTKNRTKNYTYTNMLNALQITLNDGYAVKLPKLYQGRVFGRGTSSMLKMGPRLS